MRSAREKKKQGLPADGAFVKSIVSTNLADAIAADYGVKLYEVLTGFKLSVRKCWSLKQKKRHISLRNGRKLRMSAWYILP